eukprot:g16684.t1
MGHLSDLCSPLALTIWPGHRFPAAEVSPHLEAYNLTKTSSWTGKSYDHALIKRCLSTAVEAANGAVENRWSWRREKIDGGRETDVERPFSYRNGDKAVGVVVPKDFIEKVKAGNGDLETAPSSGTFSYRSLARNLEHTNFEMITYHAFAVLTEDYRFRDVTNITGAAMWGSYLEAPQLLRGPRAAKEGVVNNKGHKITLKDVVPGITVVDVEKGVEISLKQGARIADLHPIWVSDEAVRLSERKEIAEFSSDAAEVPLFIFHVDHDGDRWGANENKEQWDRALALKEH